MFMYVTLRNKPRIFIINDCLYCIFNVIDHDTRQIIQVNFSIDRVSCIVNCYIKISKKLYAIVA